MENSLAVNAITTVQVSFVFAGCFKCNPKMNDCFNFLTPKPGSYSSGATHYLWRASSAFHDKKIYFSRNYTLL
jgi:hypothetical protein